MMKKLASLVVLASIFVATSIPYDVYSVAERRLVWAIGVLALGTVLGLFPERRRQ